MKNLNNEIFYCTTDLSLAGALLSYYPLSNLNLENPKKAVFIFKKDKKFDLAIEKYWHGDLRVDPRQYFNNLKMLKSRIHNQ